MSTWALLGLLVVVLVAVGIAAFLRWGRGRDDDPTSHDDGARPRTVADLVDRRARGLDDTVAPEPEPAPGPTVEPVPSEPVAAEQVAADPVAGDPLPGDDGPVEPEPVRRAAPRPALGPLGVTVSSAPDITDAAGDPAEDAEDEATDRIPEVRSAEPRITPDVSAGPVGPPWSRGFKDGKPVEPVDPPTAPTRRVPAPTPVVRRRPVERPRTGTDGPGPDSSAPDISIPDSTPDSAPDGTSVAPTPTAGGLASIAAFRAARGDRPGPEDLDPAGSGEAWDHAVGQDPNASVPEVEVDAVTARRAPVDDDGAEPIDFGRGVAGRHAVAAPDSRAAAGPDTAEPDTAGPDAAAGPGAAGVSGDAAVVDAGAAPDAAAGSGGAAPESAAAPADEDAPAEGAGSGDGAGRGAAFAGGAVAAAAAAVTVAGSGNRSGATGRSDGSDEAVASAGTGEAAASSGIVGSTGSTGSTGAAESTEFAESTGGSGFGGTGGTSADAAATGGADEAATADVTEVGAGAGEIEQAELTGQVEQTGGAAAAEVTDGAEQVDRAERADGAEQAPGVEQPDAAEVTGPTDSAEPADRGEPADDAEAAERAERAERVSESEQAGEPEQPASPQRSLQAGPTPTGAPAPIRSDQRSPVDPDLVKRVTAVPAERPVLRGAASPDTEREFREAQDRITGQPSWSSRVPEQAGAAERAQVSETRIAGIGLAATGHRESGDNPEPPPRPAPRLLRSTRPVTDRPEPPPAADPASPPATPAPEPEVSPTVSTVSAMSTAAAATPSAPVADRTEERTEDVALTVRRPGPAPEVVVPGTAPQDVEIRVLGPDDAALAGAAVELRDRAGTPAGSAVTGSDGIARVPAPGAGEFAVVARLDGHRPGVAAVSVADTAVTVTVRLRRSATVRGTVLTAGGPAAGVPVALEQDGDPVAEARTGPDGTFRLTDLDPGRYRLVAGTGDAASGTDVEVPAGGDVEQDVTAS
ncbi:carboxypeptidase regulatory-like domain-containing protein [Pseudonocardia sp. NPDC046786]|uniref:carboxypeptidase regulatory-like domain-containing protein n=1 Tax=Pseudonocardia sp. NPDC046786 TaxID=3155471 RepID=UPI00340B70CC